MRQIFLPILTVVLAIFVLNGCTDDVVIVSNDARASVMFDFWAGARNVEVDGEIFNDGNTHIEHVELEIMFYDQYGNYMHSVFQTFVLDLHPVESFVFATDVRQSGVYDVDVIIRDFW